MTNSSFRALSLAISLIASIDLTVSSALAQEHRGAPPITQVGIDRSNLTTINPEQRNQTIEGIKSLGVQWFRDGYADHKNVRFDDFVDEVRLVKKHGLKMLQILTPISEDFDEGDVSENAGDSFCKLCGWPQGSSRYSAIDSNKLEKRLRKEFDALKAAKVEIDAFEIGNEVNWICFNGDVPDGHIANQEEYIRALRGYANFLRTAVKVIKLPCYFPAAKIVTFGVCNASDRKHSFSGAKFVADLQSLDGKNFLDNADYRLDGYAIHIYPQAANISEQVKQQLENFSQTLPDKPIWITECGIDINKFPNPAASSRADGIRQFFSALDSLNQIAIGPLFWYSYNINGRQPGGSELVDLSGQLLPDSKVIAQRASIAQQANLLATRPKSNLAPRNWRRVYENAGRQANSMQTVTPWNEFFRSPAGMFHKGHDYRISFRYNVLAATQQGSFYSVLQSTSGPNRKSNWQEWTGKPGEQGKVEFLVEGDQVADDALVLGIRKRGAISISNIVIEMQ